MHEAHHTLDTVCWIELCLQSFMAKKMFRHLEGREA